MKTQPTENDILKTMFRLMPEEKLPLTFQQEMMLRIQKEAKRMQKRNSVINLCLLLLASLLIVGLCATCLIYLDIPKIQIPTIEISPFYLFIGIAALILLLADLFFRKAYYKKHPELTNKI